MAKEIIELAPPLILPLLKAEPPSAWRRVMTDTVADLLVR